MQAATGRPPMRRALVAAYRGGGEGPWIDLRVWIPPRLAVEERVRGSACALDPASPQVTAGARCPVRPGGSACSVHVAVTASAGPSSVSELVHDCQISSRIVSLAAHSHSHSIAIVSTPPRRIRTLHARVVTCSTIYIHAVYAPYLRRVSMTTR